VKVLHEVEVRALPADLPHGFEVDVTSLATIDAQIHVKDIKLPKGVTMVTDGEEVVALIAAFKEETEEAPVLDLDSIEVEQKGKKEEEGEAAAE
jgi:large subunit ribosomal protein L25